MDSVLLLVAAILGGCGIVIVTASVIMVIAVRGMARNSRLEHEMLRHRLQAISASRRKLPNQNTSGFK